MAHFDLPLAGLRAYRSASTAPDDLDAFWQRTIGEARSAATAPVLTSVDTGLASVDVRDLTFSGFAGQPVKGWLVTPRQVEGPLPCVVEFIGYGGARGLAHQWLLWASAGYAHLVMDTRGQGSNDSLVGATADPDSGAPATRGFVTRGIADPETYYYRRLFTDAVRAVDVARALDVVDAARVAVSGNSQGGAMAIAATALGDGVAAAMVGVPFLCDIERAMGLVDTAPYGELVTYCRTHRYRVGQVRRTLSYVDGVHLAARASAATLFAVGLMDEVCPPSTVFAAYNAWAGADKQIEVWEYDGHDGGAGHQEAVQVRWLAERIGAAPGVGAGD